MKLCSSHLIISWRSSCFLAHCNILPLISSRDALLTSWIFILCPTEALPFEGIPVVTNTRGNGSLSSDCNVRKKYLHKKSCTVQYECSHWPRSHNQCLALCNPQFVLSPVYKASHGSSSIQIYLHIQKMANNATEL